MARILVVLSSLTGANADLVGNDASVLDAAVGVEYRVRRVREVALVADTQPGAERAQLASSDELGRADGFVFT